MRPKFTIVICSNDKDRFEKCYQNCLNQLYSNFEIIVVSSTLTNQVLSEITTDRADQKYLLFTTRFITVDGIDNNYGYYRNTGIAYSTGNYILFLEDNHEINEFYLEFVSNVIEKSTILPDIVFSKAKIEDKNGVITEFVIPEGKVDLSKIKLQTTELDIPTCSFMVSKIYAELNAWAQSPLDSNPAVNFLSRIFSRPIEIKKIDSFLSKVHFNKNSFQEITKNIITTIANSQS